jgi:hypothetical protein
MQWSQSLKVKDAAKEQFARATVADALLVAHAKLTGAAVVTFEKSAPEGRKEIKVPDACKFLGVEFVDTFVMLRTLGVKLS